MLPEVEKAKYKAELTPLPASGRGGMRAWVPASAPAPTTAVPGRAHPPLPATLTPPPTCDVPSARAPTAPPVASPPLLPSNLARMFDEPIGLGAAPAAPPAPSMARTALPERCLNPSPPREVELPFYHHGSRRSSTITAIELPAGMPPAAATLVATLVNRLGGQLKAKTAIIPSASATSSASCSSDVSEPEPGNTATHAPPPTRAAPPAAPTAQLAAPPPLPASSDSPLHRKLQAVMNASQHATLTAPTRASEVDSAESELMEAVLADEVGVLELQSMLGSLPAEANPETVAGKNMLGMRAEDGYLPARPSACTAIRLHGHQLTEVCLLLLLLQQHWQQ